MSHIISGWVHASITRYDDALSVSIMLSYHVYRPQMGDNQVCDITSNINQVNSLHFSSPIRYECKSTYNLVIIWYYSPHWDGKGFHEAFRPRKIPCHPNEVDPSSKSNLQSIFSIYIACCGFCNIFSYILKVQKQKL